MSMVFFLELRHTGSIQEDIVLSDIVPSDLTLASDLNATFLRVNEPVRLPFNDRVLASYKTGQIRQHVLNGNLDAFVMTEGVPINGVSVIDAPTYIIHEAEYFILVENTTGNYVVVDLPLGTSHIGQVKIMDIRGNASSNQIIIQSIAAEPINGSIDHVIAEDFGEVTLTFANGEWTTGTVAPPVEGPPVDEDPVDNGLPKQLINGDFTLGDLTGWQMVLNGGTIETPSVKSYSLLNGPLGESHVQDDMDDFYLYSGVGFDGADYPYIYQDLDVTGKREFKLSARFGSIGDSNSDISIELIFKDAMGNTMEEQFLKTLILSFPSRSIYNGSYTLTSKRGMILDNGMNPYFTEGDMTKGIWRSNADGIDKVLMYNDVYGWCVYVVSYDSLEEGIFLGEENLDHFKQDLGSSEGILWEDLYYPVSDRIVTSYSNHAIRSHKYDRHDGIGYPTELIYKESGRLSVPEGSETLTVKVTFEKVDGSTSGEMESFVDQIKLGLFDNVYSGWDQDISGSGVSFEEGDSFCAILGQDNVSTAVTPVIEGNKIYAEFMVYSTNADDLMMSEVSSAVLGTVDATYDPNMVPGTLVGDDASGHGYFTETGDIRHNMVDGFILDGRPEGGVVTLGLAVDRTTGEVWISRIDMGVRTWLGGGDPVQGINASWVMADPSVFRFAVSDVHSAQEIRVDFRGAHMNEMVAPEGFSGI